MQPLFLCFCREKNHSLVFVSRQCRYAGILNQEVQGGYSQFNFGFIGLATSTPIEQMSVTYAHKWFKELWHSRTRQESISLRQMRVVSNGLSDVV